MIEENLLDAVIGLPGNLFPTTNIPVAILVFDRGREKPRMNTDTHRFIPTVSCFSSNNGLKRPIP
jgi:type I restriction-modification system DNA methylase subunit